MKIVPFTKDHLEFGIQIFIEDYSEAEDRQWNAETAKKYLLKDLEEAPEYCYCVVDDLDQPIAMIVCRLDPYYSGTLLFIDSINVAKEYRQQGIAKKLIRHVVELAKEHNVNGVHLFGDGRKGYPRSWYEQMGFTQTGWIEYEVNLKDLVI